MAKDRHSRSQNVRTKSHRNPNLLSHYHELSTRVFYNGGRANEYLHNLFLKAAKNGEEERIRNFLVRSSTNSNVNLNYKDKSTGNTAVGLAAAKNHVNIVKMLLNYGADITLLNNDGQSIFEVAPPSIIPMLLASVERQGTSNRHLLQAAWQGNLQILRRLLSSKADLDINCKNADGLTPLLLVTRDVNLFEKIEKNVAEKGYNPLDVVKELLQHKADCSMTASDGKSPLHYIAYNKGTNAENMANLMIEDTSSQLDLPDQSNSLPIHLASKYDNRPVLLALINGGADVNARGQLGQTPLHVAAVHGHERSSSTLISSGADVTIVDDHGNSPVDVSKNRKVKIVLKEAWVEQTRESSYKVKRSYSDPTELLTQEEKRLNENAPDSVISPRIEQTSPRKISSGTLPDVGENNESQVPHPPKTTSNRARRSHSMTKNPGYMLPRPPGTSPAGSVRVKYRSQTRQISSFSANAGLRNGRQEFELPKLTIKNIELQLTSSLRSDVPLQQPSSCYGSIQRFRFLNNPSSLPLTPSSCQRESMSRMSDYSSSQGSGRVKLPKTLAPLVSEGRKSSDMRQGSSRNSPYTGYDLVGDVLDLDNLKSPRSFHPSLAKIVFHPEDREIIQLPPSPCGEEGLDLNPPPSPCGDNELEYETNGRQSELEDNVNTAGENATNNGVIRDSKDEKLNLEENNENEKKRLNEKENKEEISSCNNCLINGRCEDTDECYKTQTFSSKNLSKFWIPCTRNGETRSGNADNVVETLMENKNNEQENTSVTNKMDKEKVGTAIMDERNKEENRKNSVSFYVDFGDTKSHNLNQACECGKPRDDEKLNKCRECRNRLSEKKTFWISLDGETSDGETDGACGTKKCVERKGSSSDDGERFSRRAQSLPDNKLPFEPKFTRTNCTDRDVEPHEQDLKDKYFIVSSEDTVVIQRQSLEEGVSEVLAKDDKESESCELKFYSEDTFVIEKNDEESTSDSGSSDGQNTELMTGNIVDECNDGAGEHKESEGDNRGVVREHEKLKSSIVLQSLSLDDEQQNERNEEASGPENGANPQLNDQEMKQAVEPETKVAETLKGDAPVFLRTAWSNDGTTEQPLGVKIYNPFPSPVPSVQVKPMVQPPIGNTLGKSKLRKTNSGKLKKKTSAKELSKKKDDKNSIGKDQPSCSGKKGKKGKKGKGKKPRPTFKEITVNQSFGCISHGDVTSNVACELKEGMLSPDVDKMPTLSIESRSANKLLRRRFSSLSPIPESPRSVVSVTPRTGEEGGCGNAEAQERSPVNEELAQQEEIQQRASNIKDAVALEASPHNDEPVKQGEKTTELIDKEKTSTEEGKDDDHDGGTVRDDDQMDDADEGVDEVDGGFLSRMFHLCMPRLGMAPTECDTEPLCGEDAAAAVNDNNDDDDDDDDDDDAGIINKTCHEEHLRFPVDEADQDMEDMIQDILQSYDHDKRDVEDEQEVHEEQLPAHNQDNTGSGPDASASSSESTSSSNAHLRLEEQRNETKCLKEKWTKCYVRQMSDFSPWEFEAPDDVFAENENHVEGSVCMAPYEEMLSDDSSYVSCESTAYAVSECSTSESTDSYFSSKESFATLSSQDDPTPGSVDIILHEKMHKSSMTGSSSGSNDSRSTIRPRSNSNSSQTSVQSFFPSATRGFVRSQVSSGSGSLSSTTSCGEELQWQKGSILGKGGFGTVYLGLVNTGEMIAVKQVELNNKEESEAEKQYEKLQEEVSLLKSLHHQNIVKYIGTCLDDNSIVNIFMEFVPGGSIAQALKRFGAFVEPVFKRYTKQILSGVEYLHKKNVIHRDIKGGNIMLMPNGVIKLIDFGCAKRLCMSLSLSRSSIMHSMKGTPYWMAPEVIKETSGQGTKSDIWSIGCTVYEMATGSPPWSPMDPLAAMFAIGSGTTVPQLGNSFSQSARDFTALCMTREPSARPSASELLQHEFIAQINIT